MTFPTSRLQSVVFVVVVAAALLLISVDVRADAVGSPSDVAALPVVTPSVTSGDAGIKAKKAVDVGAKPGQPLEPKVGVAICNGREFVQAHNKVRLGQGMPPLKWDKELARYSRRFASRRAGDCKMIHSYGPYGENIFWGAQAIWSPSQVVDSWASENKFYDPTHNTCAAGEVCGHYTQIVWRDSARVGCAWVPCLNGGMYAICTYDPPGNYVNESPFETHTG